MLLYGMRRSRGQWCFSAEPFSCTRFFVRTRHLSCVGWMDALLAPAGVRAINKYTHGGLKEGEGLYTIGLVSVCRSRARGLFSWVLRTCDCVIVCVCVCASLDSLARFEQEREPARQQKSYLFLAQQGDIMRNPCTGEILTSNDEYRMPR